MPAIVPDAGRVPVQMAVGALGWVWVFGFPRTRREPLSARVDGAFNATLNEHASATSYRNIVGRWGWTETGSHTIKIVNSATSGHPRFDPQMPGFGDPVAGRTSLS